VGWWSSYCARWHNHLPRNGTRFSSPITVMLVLLLLMHMFLFPVAASASQLTTGIQTYQLNAGDTFWLLAQRYGTTVDEIRALNTSNPEALKVGETLYIPVQMQQDYIRYRVQTGDTLFLISRRVNRSVIAIKQASQLNGDVIYPGQWLLLPPAREGASAYNVAPGDSLFQVARNHGTSVDTLVSFNRLPSTQLLVGQVLEIPAAEATPPVPAPPAAPAPPPDPAPPPPTLPVHRVAPGETLSTIAARYQTTIAAIYGTNRLNSDILMPGQPLYIPVGQKQAVMVEGPKGEQRQGFGELLDWDWARWIYNVGSTATVVDLATGKRFRIRHMGGSNHADSEPLTAADTAVMKSLFGGVWSWNKRPVLLETNGRVLAASIAGMPHDVQTIYDNNFPGHFDLYFWNSRSHNNNQIQPEHQTNVLKAAGR